MSDPEAKTRPCVEVDAGNRQITVRNLTLKRDEVYNFFSKFDDLERDSKMVESIEMGTAVLTKVNVATDINYVESRVKDMLNQFRSGLINAQEETKGHISKMFDPSTDGSHAKAIKEAFGQQRKSLSDAVDDASKKIEQAHKEMSDKFDPENTESYAGKINKIISDFWHHVQSALNLSDTNSLLGKLKVKLDEIFKEDGGKLANIMDKRISVTSTESPLYKWKEEIKKEIVKLNAEIAKMTGKSEEREKGPAKGGDFEDIVEQRLDEIAKGAGDIATRMSGTPRPGTKNKKGDFVYETKDRRFRIVLETKDEEMGATGTTLQSLDEAISNREANHGIWLVKSPQQILDRVGLWQDYDDNKIITYFDFLEPTIKFVKAKLYLTRQKIGEIDTAKMRQRLDAARDILVKHTSEIIKKATIIRNHADSVEKAAKDLRQAAEIQLDDIMEEIGTGQESDGQKKNREIDEF